MKAMKDFYYTKFYDSAEPDNFSIWKITEDKKFMCCVYDPEGLYEGYIQKKQYQPGTGTWRDDKITEEEAFLLML